MTIKRLGALYYVLATLMIAAYCSSSVSALIPALPVQVKVTIPDGYMLEEGQADVITVGSAAGNLEAFCLGIQGSLYRYDNYTMTGTPWVLMDLKSVDGYTVPWPLEDVSMSSDGVLCIIDARGKAWQYDWDKKAWSQLINGTANEGLVLSFIAVGSEDNIWAVDLKNKNLLQYSENGWVVKQEGGAIYVAAGSDGTVVGINEAGMAFSYMGNDDWDDMTGAKLSRVAVGSSENILGIGLNGELYKFAGKIATHDAAELAAQPSAAPAPAAQPTKADKADKKTKKGSTWKRGKKAAKKAAQSATPASVNPLANPVLAPGASPSDTVAGSVSDSKWTQIGSGFAECAINAAGTVFAIDSNDAIYHFGDTAVPVESEEDDTETIAAPATTTAAPAATTPAATPTTAPADKDKADKKADRASKKADKKAGKAEGKKKAVKRAGKKGKKLVKAKTADAATAMPTATTAAATKVRKPAALTRWQAKKSKKLSVKETPKQPRKKAKKAHLTVDQAAAAAATPA